MKQDYCTELLRHTKEINTVQYRSVTTWNKVQICSVLYLFLLYASATLYSNLVSRCYRSVLYCIYFFCMPQQLCTVTLFHVVTDLYCTNKYSTEQICNNVKQGYCTELLMHTKVINTVQYRSVTSYRAVTCTVFISFVCLSNSVQ
jgi:hypothetical protein